MATDKVVSANAIKNDGGVIVTPQNNSFGSTRWEEGNEIFGVGLGVDALPKSGLPTIDAILTSAGAEYAQPGQIIAKVTTDLANVSNTTMQKMDKGQHLDNPKRDNATSNLVATAVRNNQWSTVSGVFTTTPTTGQQVWGTDFSSVPTGGITSTVGNKFRFLAGGPDPSGATFKGKTVW